MNSFVTKLKGFFNKAGGNLKEGLGRDSGDRSTQAEGIVQQYKGHAQTIAGEAKSVVDDIKSRTGKGSGGSSL